MKSFNAMVDRLEGDMVVLLIGDEGYRIVLPQSYLPEDAKEGSVLAVSVEVDTSATREAKERIQNLIDKLSRGEG